MICLKEGAIQLYLNDKYDFRCKYKILTQSEKVTYKIPWNIFLIGFVLFVEIKGCGIFPTGGLGLGNFNLLGILQLVSIISMIVVFLMNLNTFKYNNYNSLRLPSLLLFVLFFIALAKSIIDCFVLKEITVSELMYAVKRMHIYLLFFFLLALLKTPADLKKFLVLIVYLAILCSLVEFYVSFFNESTGTVIISRGESITTKWRLYSLTGSFIALGFFIKTGEVIIKRKINIVDILFILILVGGILIQFHRSVLVSFFFCLFLAFIYSIYQIRKKRKIFISIILFFVLIFVSIGYYLLKNNDNYIFDLIKTSVNIEKTPEGGSVTSRTAILVNTVDYIVKRNLVFGTGFSWHITSDSDYQNNKFALYPTFDSSFTNIILVFGFPGALVFTFLFFQILKVHMAHLRSKNDLLCRVIALGSILTALYLFLTSYFTDNIMGLTGTIIFIIVWVFGLTYQRDIKQKNVV